MDGMLVTCTLGVYECGCMWNYESYILLDNYKTFLLRNLINSTLDRFKYMTKDLIPLIVVQFINRC